VYHLLTLLNAGIHNAVVHAQARYAFAITSLQDEQLAVIVHDNGYGFNVKTLEQKVGITGIIGAALQLNADLKYTSTLRNGTVVNAIISKPRTKVSAV